MLRPSAFLPVRAYFTTAHRVRWSPALLALLWLLKLLRRPHFARARRALLLATADEVLAIGVRGLRRITEGGRSGRAAGWRLR